VRVLSLFLLVTLGGCTAGATATGTVGTTTSAATTTIDISLTNSVVVPTAYGTSGGFTPAVTTVALGSTVRFVNTDSFAHTSTSMNATTFPAASPFSAAALTQSGSTLSGGWSAGALAAGTASQPILADKPGTYLYGCFFHYGAPMRAAIVVP
jgi:plastocyanin